MLRTRRTVRVSLLLISLGLLSSCALQARKGIISPSPAPTSVSKTQTPSPQAEILIHTPSTRGPSPTQKEQERTLTSPVLPSPSALGEATHVVASAIFAPTDIPHPEESRAAENIITVTLDVDSDVHTLNVKEPSTAYDLLVQAQRERKITFSGKQFSGLGFFVEEINGKKQIPGRMYWILYVNGEKSSVGVSSYFLRPADIIRFHYEPAE